MKKKLVYTELSDQFGLPFVLNTYRNDISYVRESRLVRFVKY